MPLDAALLDILVCPIDRGTLLLIGSETDGTLYNPRLHKAYRIENSIPVLLSDEARDVTDAEHQRFTE
ncbi:MULTISPECIES: Trm112 family protein [unclassified Mycobacterium]|uniref:Trm112 family protein n=1 Tax=unclassified Mycobacterium TaxID=2642494 RepID=UPI00099406E9|nr:MULTISPECIES: Trm112 family protein [unclassified Mycobacterium]